MDSFDKHTRKSLTESGQVPEGFGWEDMQADINQKISEKKPKRKYPIWFWIFPLACLGLGVLWMGNAGVGTPNGESTLQNKERTSYADLEQGSEADLNETLDESPSETTLENTAANTIQNTNQETVTNSINKKTLASASLKLNQNITTKKETSVNLESTKVQGSLIDNQVNKWISSKGDNQKNILETLNVIENKLENESNSKLAETDPIAVLIDANDARTAQKFDLLTTIEFLHRIESNRKRTSSFTQMTVKAEASDEQIGKNTEMYLLTTVNAGLWRWNQTPDLAAFSIVDFEKPLETYGASMKIGYRVNKWFVETGVVAQVHSSYFENVFERKYTTAADSSPIYNTLTMETRYESGGTKNVTERFKIGHFNQYGQIDIPVLVGMQIPIRRLAIYAKTGVQVSVLSWEKGRSITEVGELDELVSSTEYRGGRGWTYLAEGGLAYDISSTCAIQSGFSYAHTLTSWMESDSNLRRPSRLSLELGFKMRLR